jgi:Right handed beta helix region
MTARTQAALGALLLTTAVACSSALPRNAAPLTAPTEPPARVCDHQVPGLASPPAGAVIIDPAVDNDLRDKTIANLPGTTFWLAPGRHTLGANEFGQVSPKDRDTYLGAPGAVLDGRGINRYAFTQRARDVTIRYLTVQGFIAPRDQGVVNHDSGDGWVIEHNLIQNNRGAGLMAGAHQQVRYNCLRNNGQYGMNAYQPGDSITGLVVERNEISGNNADDWETRVAGCGCTGGIKFWAVNGADVRSNWIHDNHGPGLWADTNNNDFLVEGNLIEGNDAEAVFYETSYNLILRANTLRNNAWVKGKMFADRKDPFPVAAIYLSEAGGEPRFRARTNGIEIYRNVVENNWSGITAWENSDRFCSSPANTSTGYCTRLVSALSQCAQPGITTKPLYDDCRWKTQHVHVHDNTFTFTPPAAGCTRGLAGRIALLSNYGTFPDWSPYKADVVKQAITFTQDNRWWNNSYTGPWKFVVFDTGRTLDAAAWQAEPYKQDSGSTFAGNQPAGGC